MKHFLRRAWPPVVAVLALGIAWWLGVAIFEPAAYVLPSPKDVLEAADRTQSELWRHTRTTFTEASLGLILGVGCGAVIAIILAVSRPLRRFVEPLLILSQSVPPVVLTPIVVMWLGFGLNSRLVVVTLVCFFPVVIASIGGLLHVDPLQLEYMQSQGASRGQLLTQLQIPGALPAFFSGARVAAAYAVFGAVVAEWMGASAGLGVYMQRSQSSYRTDQLFVAVIIIAVMGAALFYLTDFLSRLSTPWKSTQSDQGEL